MMQLNIIHKYDPYDEEFFLSDYFRLCEETPVFDSFEELQTTENLLLMAVKSLEDRDIVEFVVSAIRGTCLTCPPKPIRKRNRIMILREGGKWCEGKQVSLACVIMTKTDIFMRAISNKLQEGEITPEKQLLLTRLNKLERKLLNLPSCTKITRLVAVKIYDDTFLENNS